MGGDGANLMWERDHPLDKLAAAVSVLSDGIDSAARAGQLERLLWLAIELGELHQDVMDVLAEIGTGPGVVGGR